MKIKTTISLLFIALILSSCNNKKNEYKSFDEYPVTHENLWLNYTENYTIFKIWSPTAENVQLHLYNNGFGGNTNASHNLNENENGVWELKLTGD